MKKSKYIHLVFCSILLQSCITTFKKTELELPTEIQKINSNYNCITIKIFALSQTELGTEHRQLFDVTDVTNKDDLEPLEKSIGPFLKKSSECSKLFEANIYLKVKPKNDRIFWPLMSIITLGIIPYWNEYENLMEVNLYDKGIFQKKIASQINYSQIYSLFLIPAMPFYDNVYNDLGENILNKHAEIIKKNFKD